MAYAYFDSEETRSLRNDIRNLVDQTNLRWIFVGGKGGVGKTTISCSIASILTEHRESVLLLSTDPAHSLSDAFGQKFTDDPRLVRGYKNLYAMELDTSHINDSDFPQLSNHGNTITSSDLPGIIQMLPGLDEALNFAELMQSVQSTRFSVIIFDTAPTGHTLKFLQLPDVLDRLVESFLRFESIFGAILQLFANMLSHNVTQLQMFEKIKRLKEMLIATKAQMRDPERTTFVCVCIPEFLSVYETERLIQDLARYISPKLNSAVRFDIDCSYVIVNQVIKHVELGHLQQDAWDYLDEDARSRLKDFFDAVKHHESQHNGRVAIQRRYLEDIRDLYKDHFNIVVIAQSQEEVRGADNIKKFAQALLLHSPLPLSSDESDDGN